MNPMDLTDDEYEPKDRPAKRHVLQAIQMRYYYQCDERNTEAELEQLQSPTC